MADPYDFQIESMKFRLATSDNFPYVRNTAPFRKDQFDSSPTVGDQSLTGWWTRGQLSFHKGAGLNYYEVLESDEVINRFTTSRYCDVFDPGRVTLRTGFTQLTTTGPIWSGATGRNSGLFYMDGTSTLKGTSGNGTYTNWDIAFGFAETLTGGVCVIGDYVYATYQAPGVFGIGRGYWDYPTTTDFNNEEQVYETAGTSFIQIWGAKARLWGLAADGNLYAMVPYPTGSLPTSSIGSAVATMPLPYDDAPWYASLTDGGSAVFMTMGDNHVYAFSLNSDGSVPTLSAPVVVAELPNAEDIMVIRAYLGYLVLVTTKGVRFCAISGTEITVGPLVVEWDGGTTCERIAAHGAKIYCTGVTEAGVSIGAFEFDLSEPVGNNPLIFPYAQIWHGTTGYNLSTDVSGCLEHGDGGLAIYAGNSMWTNLLTTTKQSSGYVTTAYHRFGTLDPKHFQSITVRTEGTGTIQVYRVDMDGTETSLGTFNASAGSATYSIGLSAPTERVAFKFVLTRDASDTTKGPTLLGYQIKALPVPERQRLIKAPLLINDELTLRHGTRVGHKGRAYEDVAELEALESSQAVVTYTDHRTGETGSAYIDSVDFQGDTPASENSNGFGGVAYVTLRVLS